MFQKIRALTCYLVVVVSALPSSTAQVFRVGGNVSAPKAVYSPNPEYTEQARRAKLEGVCVLWLVVGSDGVPRNIWVTRTLGMGLDEEAIKAVRTWRFEPSRKDGSPVAVQINVDVTFRLYNDPKIEALANRSDAGDGHASFKLYQAYSAGKGVGRIEEFATQYLEKAARQGLPEAQFTLAERIENRGNDPVSAYMWYSLAQRGQYKSSGKKLKELAQKMSPEQISEAERRADSEQPSRGK